MDSHVVVLVKLVGAVHPRVFIILGVNFSGLVALRVGGFICRIAIFHLLQSINSKLSCQREVEPLPAPQSEEEKDSIKTHLHHVLPSLSIISTVVGSIIQIYVPLLQVDAALAAFLSDLAVCSNHETEPKDGERDRN